MALIEPRADTVQTLKIAASFAKRMADFVAACPEDYQKFYLTDDYAKLLTRNGQATKVKEIRAGWDKPATPARQAVPAAQLILR